jgi:uncharacterized protein DUF4288
MKKLKWYAVKSLFKWVAQGRPHKTDADYDAATVLLEERVVLVKASSFSEAISNARRDARKYGRVQYKNPYGQRVRIIPFHCYDCFELAGAPSDAAEVFSSTEVIEGSRSRRSILNARMGGSASGTDRALRRKFSNQEFSGVVS